MARKLTIGLFLLLLSALTVYAQGAPGQIEAALANLSTQVGRPVALGNLDNWQWEQSNFPDSSLGCPQPNTAYAQVLTPGYKFLLTYGGKIYDYRVTIDSAVVILCSVTDANAPTPTVDPNVPVTVTYVPPCLTPEPNVQYMRIRLKIGIQGRVEPGLPNNLRALPDKDSALAGELPGGAVFTVIGGPECKNGYVWWQVDFDGLQGWTVEGVDGDYWIEPLPPLPLATQRALIATSNAAQVRELARLTGNIGGELGFSTDGTALAVTGGPGSDGVWLYDMNAIDQAPRILANDSVQTALALDPTQLRVISGGQDGWITLYDPRIRSTNPQTLQLKPFASNIAALAFSPDAKYVAVAGTLADITKDGVDAQNAIVFAGVEQSALVNSYSPHTNTVTSLAFSPSGALLASGSLDSTVQVMALGTDGWWSAPSLTLELDSPVTSLAFSAEGSLLAVGTLDGAVSVFVMVDGSVTAVIPAHTGQVNAVTFSRDNSLLVSAGDDGTAKVWDLTSSPQGGGKDMLVQLSGTFEAVSSVAFSPDGTLIATASNDSTVRLWGISNSVGG
jgi:hypothetical protein